ncbi:MAG TPA: putative quinol monooxygenase [Acidimicrobiales bacterium]|nr:putative quinol monooxygenase [Acidimicrobiales bacterium]
MIVVSGTIVLNPEKVDRALELTRALVAETRAEPGNLAYGYYADLDEPGRYHLYEEWESEEALDAHSASAHLAEFFTAVPELEISHLEITRYTVTDARKVM